MSRGSDGSPLIPGLESPEGLIEALRDINARRRGGSGILASRELERIADALLGCSRKLAVYGSLAPGEENAGVLADLEGEWFDGHVEGRLHDRGWGSGIGYPGIHWIPGEDPVAVKLLVSEGLPAHWKRIDAFEGPEYCRILVPVHADGAVIAVANLYELREITE